MFAEHTAHYVDIKCHIWVVNMISVQGSVGSQLSPGHLCEMKLPVPREPVLLDTTRWLVTSSTDGASPTRAEGRQRSGLLYHNIVPDVLRISISLINVSQLQNSFWCKNECTKTSSLWLLFYLNSLSLQYKSIPCLYLCVECVVIGGCVDNKCWS